MDDSDLRWHRQPGESSGHSQRWVRVLASHGLDDADVRLTDRYRGKLRLEWRPREENQEADNLTNEIFDGFDPCKRVAIQLGDLPLELFLSLQSAYA